MANRRIAQRTGKNAPRRPKLDPLSPTSISDRRRISAPARISVSPVRNREERRSVSPRIEELLRLCSSQVYDVRKPRSPRPNQRRRFERPSRSEAVPDQPTPATPTTSMGSALDRKEALQELCALLVQHGGPTGHTKSDDFMHAPLEPPITKSSLSELDIGSIVNNCNLRHDINFDRELHFRPNLDGARGTMKRQAQAAYWSALVAELELYSMIASNVSSNLGGPERWNRLTVASKRRVPRMFEAVRELLKALVPEQDQPLVDAQLDVDIIMQEIERGICDLPRIARWLSQMLKAHCAPMRDTMIDKMVSCIDEGVTKALPHLLIDGLIQMFGVLEAMKLDVANHQIRHLRLGLIDDTIIFEQKYHCDRIEHQRFDPESSRGWYRAQETQARSMLSKPNGNELSTTTHLSIFLNAFLDHVLCPLSQESLPGTFNLDVDRVRVLRTDISNMLLLDACEKVFIELTTTLGRCAIVSSSARQALRSAISSVINYSPHGADWHDNLDHIVLEVVRQAILTNGGQSESLTCTIEDKMLKATADKLHAMFLDADHSFLWRRGAQLKDEMLSAITRNVERFLHCSPIDIFNAFTVSKSNGTHRKKEHFTLGAQPHEEVLRDLVRRISHIAVLHWRTWAPIVYLNEPEAPPTTLTKDPLSESRNRLAPKTTEGLWTQVEDLTNNTATGDAVGVSTSTTSVGTAVTGPTPAEDTMVAGSHDPTLLADEPSSPVLYR